MQLYTQNTVCKRICTYIHVQVYTMYVVDVNGHVH